MSKSGKSRNNIWYGDEDPNISGDDYLESGTYTLETKIVSYWDQDDHKTVQNNFNIIPGGPFATVPYSTSFDAGFDSYYWDRVFTTPNRARTTASYGPHFGSKHLVMSRTTDIIPGYKHTWAYLKVNLQSTENPAELSFWWKDFGDENHSQDAVYFSDNAGNSWYKVYNFNPQSNSNNVWRKVTLDIDQICSSTSLTASNQFCIKFSQYDNKTINHYDGIAIDDVIVSIKSGGEAKSSKANKSLFTNIDDIGSEGIKNQTLENYPNPFTNYTIINYCLEEDSRVIFEIYNMTGQKIVTLVNKNKLSGSYNIVWDCTSDNGENVPKGIYFGKLYVDSMNKRFSKTLPLIKVE